MLLGTYFETNDGSLPEIEIHFSQFDQSRAAFELLFSAGAVDATVGGATLWSIRAASELPFSGKDASPSVLAGEVEPFHVVLAGIKLANTEIPNLGVFYDPLSLTLDYRMGPSWGEPQVLSLIFLLKKFVELGGTIEVPWWGTQGQIDFSAVIKNV